MFENTINIFYLILSSSEIYISFWQRTIYIFPKKAYQLIQNIYWIICLLPIDLGCFSYQMLFSCDKNNHVAIYSATLPYFYASNQF